MYNNLVTNIEINMKQLENIGLENIIRNTDSDKRILTSLYLLPLIDIKLKGTPFYYDKLNDYIHFTAAESLDSIITLGNMRMYSLNSMDDILEMEHALNDLGFEKDDDLLKTEKESIFCLSMCSGKVLKDETKMHRLWKLHGWDGKGACIRLGFENRDKWLNYHLIEVNYTKKNEKNYPEWIKTIKEANEKNNKIELDRLISCFIKNEIYSFEEEIRLVFDNREEFRTENFYNGENIYPIKHIDRLLSPKKIYYFNLPLSQFDKKQNDYEIQHINETFEMPKIVLKEIILGYRYNKRDVKYFKEKFDFQRKNISVRLSNLKKYY